MMFEDDWPGMGDRVVGRGLGKKGGGKGTRKALEGTERGLTDCERRFLWRKGRQLGVLETSPSLFAAGWLERGGGTRGVTDLDGREEGGRRKGRKTEWNEKGESKKWSVLKGEKLMGAISVVVEGRKRYRK
jgi:hypothetical protein